METMMSRSGYSDDYDDQWGLICWRGAVASAIRGKRGQAFLREMLAAMDALPEKKLIKGDLEADGAVCAIGSVGRARGVDMSGLDPEDREKVAATFGIAPAMAAEIVYENDEQWGASRETPEERFTRMRQWIEAKLIEWDAAP
jgi:hypothetical protein